MHDLPLIALKGVVGGTFVVVFALIGQVVRPKTLAGIFGAAPSVALASLAVTAIAETAAKASEYAAGMIAGAVALVAYCVAVSVSAKRLGALSASALSMLAWGAPCAVLYVVLLR